MSSTGDVLVDLSSSNTGTAAVAAAAAAAAPDATAYTPGNTTATATAAAAAAARVEFPPVVFRLEGDGEHGKNDSSSAGSNGNGHEEGHNGFNSSASSSSSSIGRSSMNGITSSAAGKGLGIHPNGISLPPMTKQGIPWVLQESEFNPGLVGAKALNLATLRRQLPAWVVVPASVALPFATFEAVLGSEVNEGVRGKLEGLLGQLKSQEVKGGLPAQLLEDVRTLVAEELQAPPGLQQVGGMMGWLS